MSIVKEDNKIEEILKEAIKENALYMRDRQEWSIDKANESVNKLSQELAFIAGILIGFFQFVSSKIILNNSIEKVVALIFVLSSVFTVIIRVVYHLQNKSFWDQNIDFANKNLENWMNARNRITSKKSIFSIHEESHAFQSGLEQFRSRKTPDWPILLQIVLLVTAAISLLIIYIPKFIFS